MQTQRCAVDRLGDLAQFSDLRTLTDLGLLIRFNLRIRFFSDLFGDLQLQRDIGTH